MWQRGRVRKSSNLRDVIFEKPLNFFLDESSPLNGQMHNLRLGDQQLAGQSSHKPVNLLPEIPAPTSRKLNEREQRDCEVIGKHFRGARTVHHWTLH